MRIKKRRMPYSSISKDKDSDIFENNAETGLLLLAKGPCLTASYSALAENKHSYNSLKQVLLVV